MAVAGQPSPRPLTSSVFLLTPLLPTFAPSEQPRHIISCLHVLGAEDRGRWPLLQFWNAMTETLISLSCSGIWAIEIPQTQEEAPRISFSVLSETNELRANFKQRSGRVRCGETNGLSSSGWYPMLYKSKLFLSPPHGSFFLFLVSCDTVVHILL